MPTKRRRIPRTWEPTQVSPTKWAFFGTGAYPPGGAVFEILLWYHPSREHGDVLERDWRAARQVILAEWIQEHPGTRPWAWWLLDAPRPSTIPARIARAGYASRFRDPRRRVGGRGTPCYEVLNYAPDFRFGLPTHWVDAFSVAYYNGRALDVQGRPIGTEYREGQFVADAYDPNDPPMFESQAAYLERHGLLTPGERQRLTAGDFAPEAIEFDDEVDTHADPDAEALSNGRF